MALFPHPRGCLFEYPTQQSRKISIPLINNLPGKNCLERRFFAISLGNLFSATLPIKSIFTLRGQCTASRLFSPASPTASPESE
jgi:hypothetical protein